MPPNRFESEVGNFLEGSHGDRTHIKRAGHHTVTPLCGTLLRGLGLERCCCQSADPLGERCPKTTVLVEWVCTLVDSSSGVACCPDRFPAAAWPVLLGRAAVCAGGRRLAAGLALPPPRQISGRRVACFVGPGRCMCRWAAARPRDRHTRAWRLGVVDLEARPGPATAHRHRGQALQARRRPPIGRRMMCWCVVRRSVISHAIPRQYCAGLYQFAVLHHLCL